MSGLNGAMSAAQQGLAAYSRALSIVQTNIANASTPGYARQRAVFSTGHGNQPGVRLQAIESMRSNLLEYQALAARQARSYFQGLTTFYGLVEPAFRLDGGAGIDQSIDSFFAAVSGSAANPTDMALRQNFIAAGNRLATGIRETHQNLDSQQGVLEADARATLQRVNALLGQVAELESGRVSSDPLNPTPGTETRLQQALEELSELIEFSMIRQQDGTLTLVSGSEALLTGVFVRPLRLSTTGSALQVVNAEGKNVTASFEGHGGRLGAALEARNQILPGLISDVNRLAKSVADEVNRQLERGVDLNGLPGQALFSYVESAVTGSGRTAGNVGLTTPAPPVSVEAVFSGGLTGSISATLDSFFAAALPPTVPSAGDTVTLRLTSADGTIDRLITTAPLLGGESAAGIAQRLNDQIALDPHLAGLVEVSDAGGALKLALSDEAGQGYSFSSSTFGSPGFTAGLEGGGVLGGHSAEEIAAALNAEIAANPDLAAAGVRFVATQGELRLDGDIAFEFSITDNDAAGTGFASGLDGVSGTAGGASAAASLTITNITASQIAASAPGSPGGNHNLTELVKLTNRALIGGLTFNQFYANTVTALGSDAANAVSRLATQEQVQAAAENLRDSISGVDLNEEALSLMQFEEGYSALLRVIQVLDRMSAEVMNLVR